MSRRAAGLTLVLVWWAVLAGCSSALAAPSCTEAAGIVERQLGLPTGVLRSIGQVETGNQPWSVDSDGVGERFASAEDAITHVRREAASVRFVDVGCFQVDLAYHPDAFRNLDEAFDPLSNASAAGRYLLALRRSAGSWPEAVARYHSADPGRGGSYSAQVYKALDGRIGSGWTDAIVAAGVHVIVPDAFAVSARAGHADRFAALPTVQTP